TFYAETGRRLLEANVFDFDGDLYGQPARVAFSRRVREQERFDTVDELIAQMRRDVEAVRRGT
ncbi:MAG TPA: riboflavin kinase, partial [Acidimicrobiia bacterium]|nr:riboflavin kinase [Acidimicrobiia bacterium]